MAAQVMDAGLATVLAAIIVSVPGVVAMAVSIKNHGRLTELHLTLNSRLTELLGTIAATNQAIGRADQKRDEASVSAGRTPNKEP